MCMARASLDAQGDAPAPGNIRPSLPDGSFLEQYVLFLHMLKLTHYPLNP